jgi:hypothetical protein
LFVTTPGGQQDAAALNSMQLDSWNQRAHSPDISMSMYDASSPSPSTPMSPNLFESAINTPLPPSPDPSIMIGSPLLGNESPYHMKYEDTNTIGFGYAS